MTLTPRDFRLTIATAVLDDLLHAQPELAVREVRREGGIVWEVTGAIRPATLGVFAAQQLVHVIETNHPGLLEHLNTADPATSYDHL